MRLLGFVGLLTLGIGAAACEDAKSAAVQDDINWSVGCAVGSSGCTQFRLHDQALTTERERDFDVTCKVSGDEVSFTIRDPGLDAAKNPPGWPAASISVAGGNAAKNACVVTVTDSQEPGYAAITMRGACQSSSSDGMGGCVLTRMPASAATEGWDWVGTLECSKLARDSMPMPLYRLSGGLVAGPVTIALDNCD